MSGITGMLRFDGGPVPERDLGRMNAAIDHQGPDGEWTWRDGPVGLGHQRFETTPEATYAGSPPERGGLAITLDGRIDNRGALLAELPVEGRASEVPDDELVLAAYERWGKACPERLVGAYAFVVWDSTRKRLFAARDHVGLRPLYYYHDGDMFAFGSEMKALWTLDGVPRRLDDVRLLHHLCRQFESDERTFYEDVHRLPPGHTLVADGTGVATSQYWTFDPDRTVDLDSDEAYAERFRELFTEAVRCRLRARGPVGSTLSGGLDSSSIVATADVLCDHGNEEPPLYTYSAVFDPEELPESDEREYVQAVLDRCPVWSRFIRGDRLDPLGDIETVIELGESPEVGNNFYLHWNIYREAGDDGVRVLLDGNGGDMVVSHGIGFLPELLASGRWLRLAREQRALEKKSEHGLSVRNLLLGRTLVPLLPSTVRKAILRVRNDEVRDALNPTLAPEFVARTGNRDSLLDAHISQPRTARRRHYRQIRGGVLVSLLERLDKVSKAFGVEPRYPFFDRRLMEYCLALPPEQKIRRGWTRYVLRNAMDGVLPREVQWRAGKGNLAPSFWQALRQYSRDDVEDVLFADDPCMAEFVDVDRARAGYEAFVDGDRQGLETVWYPVLLEKWLRSTVGPNVAE